MNGHYDICNFEFVEVVMITYCLYILSLIHSRAYDTDLGLKSGRVRHPNCSSVTSRIWADYGALRRGIMDNLRTQKSYELFGVGLELVDRGVG